VYFGLGIFANHHISNEFGERDLRVFPALRLDVDPLREAGDLDPASFQGFPHAPLPISTS
jgi:hypothetical protein